MWEGSWSGDVYTGSYTFPDGTVFKGTATHLDKHVVVHATPDGFTKTVEHPTEPHFEFTGTWEKDGGAGSPMTPPDPER